MDIDYAQDYKYFEFGPKKFLESEIEQMNKQVEESKRRFVVITDCHISADKTNLAYIRGNKEELKTKFG